MKVVVVGTGYVGLVTGACLAEMGIEVAALDSNTDKIARLLQGEVPIYEPGLAPLIERNMAAGRLTFSISDPTNFSHSLAGADLIFCAVGTPPTETGEADLSQVKQVAGDVALYASAPIYFVTKSTVPIGTSRRLQNYFDKTHSAGKSPRIEVVANPEFLKEGHAIDDFMRPDRIIVGCQSSKAEETMRRLYKPFMVKSDRLLISDLVSAEMIKYASNAMLATRISFMNEMANLAEKVGADISAVRRGIGSDSRIGQQFLYAGCGYGGSCFPKDISALIATARSVGGSLEILEAVERVNTKQKSILVDKLLCLVSDPQGLKVAIWGTAFKPETDDMRAAPAEATIRRLLAFGCEVSVFDPIAMQTCHQLFGDTISYAADEYEAVKGADALMLLTEWRQFRVPNWELIARLMRGKWILDGRNIFDRAEVERAALHYYGIGLGAFPPSIPLS